MDKKVQIFEHADFGKIRAIEIDGQPWFVGKDVADKLGYSETNSMVKRLDEEDFISAKMEGMNMKSVLINESGLYTAIIGSKLPAAKAFKRWVTSHVLPSIRRHGAYINEEILRKMLEDRAFTNQILERLSGEVEKNKELRLYAKENADKAHYHDMVLLAP